MTSNIKFILITILSVLLVGCGGGGGGTPASDEGTTDTTQTAATTDNTRSEKSVTITEDNQLESLGSSSTIHTEVDMGSTPRDLYLVLSNSAASSASSTITHTAKIVPNKKLLGVSSEKRVMHQKVLPTPEHIRAFSHSSLALLKKSTDRMAKTISYTEAKKDIVGDSKTFYLETDTSQSTLATARKVVTVSTPFGNKTLSVWVSDDSFDSGSGCEKATCVTQTMVDNFAQAFLRDGEDNDIYDWVTNIYGEEWGSNAHAKYSNLITADDEISILLTDIDNDNNPNGGTVGYFYSKDEFQQSSVSGSNERIMFYADSVMFANTNNDDYWQKELYSTLAHEFQHMIHYYRRYVLADVESDTWMEEMMSETTEDLIATKLDHTGPRGVDPDDGTAGDPGNTEGRYPEFNRGNALSLVSWNNSYEDYGKVSAFGAFLVRNYGGAKVLHDIMYDTTHADFHAVEAATGKSFSELLKAWGTAVMLSDVVDSAQNIPTYNTGDFIDDTFGNTTYQLGSINCFNYDPQPAIQTNSGTVQAEGNYYYKIGSNLTGTLTIDLSLNGSTEAILIAK